jgi:hypothetical protein
MRLCFKVTVDLDPPESSTTRNASRVSKNGLLRTNLIAAKGALGLDPAKLETKSLVQARNYCFLSSIGSTMI